MKSYSYLHAQGGACPILEHLLLPPDLDLRLHAITPRENVIMLTVTAIAERVNCPCCTQPSAAIHSRYQRRVADLPLVGVRVQLNLQVRKFFCRNQDCSHKIFTGRLTPFVKAYARRTTRLRDTLEQLALDLGGEGSARLATQQGMPISHDSLLRWTRRRPESEVNTPHILGVDDWARRKGQTYGTLLVDLERHQPIDLLPDREADTFAEWLEHHPGVEIISRDRAGAYAEGAFRGAPSARQVANRFHLLQNLRDAIQRLLDRQQKVLRQVAVSQTAAPTDQSGTSAEQTSAQIPPNSISDAHAIHPTPTRLEERRQQSRTRRQSRYAEVQELKQGGLSVRAIARQLRMSRHTVQRFLATDSFPERARPPRKSSLLDCYVPYLTQQMQAEQTNGMQLWRGLCAQGYHGSRPLVSRWVAQHRHLPPSGPRSMEKATTRGRPPRMQSGVPAETIRPLSAWQAGWLVVRQPEDLDEDQRQTLARLRELSPEVQAIYPLVQEFVQMVRTRAAPLMESWLQRVRETKVREFVTFANSLERDKAAVVAGLSLPYSNGQTEGQLTRLKLIKRSMYGRGNFDLLRKRVLLADTS